MKVISYNIHKGFSLGNREYILESIRRAIRSTEADVLFLQEVVGENRERQEANDNTELETQFEYLADSVWHHFSYGKNAVYDGGHHGNAILSKYPIVQWENFDLSLNIPKSRRGALHSLIEVEGISIHLFCVHLGLLAAERKRQIKLLTKAIQTKVKPNEAVILAGDFNDWNRRISSNFFRDTGLIEVSQWQDGLANLSKKFRATFPSRLPALSLDRIYIRGLSLTSTEVLKGKPWSSLSDHCAVLANFDLTRNPPTDANLQE